MFSEETKKKVKAFYSKHRNVIFYGSAIITGTGIALIIDKKGKNPFNRNRYPWSGEVGSKIATTMESGGFIEFHYPDGRVETVEV